MCTCVSFPHDETMKTKDVGVAQNMSVQRNPAKAAPKFSFGATLAAKQEQLAQQQQEQEVLEEVAMQMSRSVLDGPKAMKLETEKADGEEENSDGW